METRLSLNHIPSKPLMNKIIPEQNGELGKELVKNMEKLTWERHGTMGLENATHNRQFLKYGHSITKLHRAPIKNDSAIIVAAGPSIKIHDPASIINEGDFKGAIIATESALMYCLRNGIIPDLAVSLDPHATRIVRWFGDPNLTEETIQDDDYYSRQDMDIAFTDEIRANDEAVKLLNQYGKNIKIALSTSASKAVVDRVLEVGMEIYWWNPMYDDPEQDGVTKELQKSNGLPAINAGGNVGSCAWMIASAVLEKKYIALTGMDFSYYEGTPYRNTQYYYEAINLVGEENLDSLYMEIYNPYSKTKFFTDPAYMWYRECFLEMAKDSASQTFNCTGGGILFGEGIDFIPLENFMKKQG